MTNLDLNTLVLIVASLAAVVLFAVWKWKRNQRTRAGK